jgi:hypothetical protein
MADIFAGQPVRSEADGTDERLHVKIVDYTSPGGADNQAEVSEKLIHVRNFGQDPATTKVQLKLSELGYANSDGVYDVTNNTLPSSNGVILHSRNVSPAATQQTLRQTGVANGAGDVRAADVAIRDEAGEPFSVSNPLPVQAVEGVGDEIFDFKDSGDIARNSSDDHDYTVTAAKTLYVKQLFLSASGAAKFDFQVEDSVGADTYTTYATFFVSASDQNEKPVFHVPYVVATGVKVRITATNKDQQPQSMYSTIVGVEL